MTARLFWCARVTRGVNGWVGGHVLAACGHADAKCERRTR